jgi:lipopolysaccharide transport system permease protein/teichoic acid transport system permease protein
MFGMFIFYEYMPSIYWIQTLYYLFATTIFLLALSWISSSIIIFFKDVGHIVNMFVQFGFWGTPIFWSYSILPERYVWVVEYNPIFYIVEGYRDSLINNVWFWDKPDATLYFWSISIMLLTVSIYTFKSLRPHFADVL